eukprot:scaffold134707_cov21-Tisochrysis_lutea.AAC.2
MQPLCACASPAASAHQQQQGQCVRKREGRSIQMQQSRSASKLARDKIAKAGAHHVSKVSTCNV